MVRKEKAGRRDGDDGEDLVGCGVCMDVCAYPGHMRMHGMAGIALVGG